MQAMVVMVMLAGSSFPLSPSVPEQVGADSQVVQLVLDAASVVTETLAPAKRSENLDAAQVD